jgi:RNA polymerase sigma-70 factor (ECF subfamily)
MSAQLLMSNPILDANLPAIAALSACKSGESGAPDFNHLVAAVRRGDEGAFHVIYEQAALTVYQRLLRWTHGDQNLARDLVQTAFIKLARQCPRVDSESHLLAWLTRVAINTHRDHLRRSSRDPINWEAESESGLPEPQYDPLLQHLREGLAALPVEDAEFLRLIYVDRQSLADVASARSLTVKAVERRLARLREKLKAQILQQLNSK